MIDELAEIRERERQRKAAGLQRIRKILERDEKREQEMLERLEHPTSKGETRAGTDQVSEVLGEILEALPGGLLPHWERWASRWISGEDRAYSSAAGTLDRDGQIWLTPDAWQSLSQAAFSACAAACRVASGYDPADQLAEARRHLEAFKMEDE